MELESGKALPDYYVESEKQAKVQSWHVHPQYLCLSFGLGCETTGRQVGSTCPIYLWPTAHGHVLECPRMHELKECVHANAHAYVRARVHAHAHTPSALKSLGATGVF